MKENQYIINEAIIYSDLGKDQTSKVLFKYKIFLANFLKLFFPMFKGMTIEDIIEQTIDWYDGPPGSTVFQLSEESNSSKEPGLREDFILMLRFPDYMQGKDKPKYFILHIEFQNEPDDIDRRKDEYSTNNNLRFNIIPYDNEDERKENLMPIYTVWIIFSPKEEDRGIIEDFNHVGRYQIDPDTNEMILVESIPYSTNTIRPYRINLDKNLGDEFRATKNLMGFLNSFFLKRSEEDFKKAQELYEIPISDEFQEEVREMDALQEYRLNEGIEIGTQKGIEIGTQKGIEIGTQKGKEEGIKIEKERSISKTINFFVEQGKSPEEARILANKILS